MAQEYSQKICAHLRSLYDRRQQQHACRAETAEAFKAWQSQARPALCGILGLDRIATDAGEFQCRVALAHEEDQGDYVRQPGVLQTEPFFEIPFWLLRPKSGGPLPLAVFPHGHEHRGMDSYVGISQSEDHLRRIREQDRDVAVQAVRQGFLAIAPATRGFEPAAIPDVRKRHGNADCRSAMIHALLAGRTLLGERVWDIRKILDWALGLPEVDPKRTLIMGNSGGGVTSLFAAACDERIGMAIASCSFCSISDQDGHIHHCDCHAVPGLLRFGDTQDIAGLIAPRFLLTVNGRNDTLFSTAEVDRVTHAVKELFSVAGASDHYRHEYGSDGHRFYQHLMWPFVRTVFGLNP